MYQFQPDNFSSSVIDFVPVSKEEFLKLSSVFAFFFPDKKINSLSQLKSTEINSHNFRIETEDGSVYLLRRAKFLKEKDQIEEYLSLIQHLEKIGVPICVNISLEKRNCIEFEEENYILYPFISGTHFSPNEESYISLAKAVAHMHQGFEKIGDEAKKVIEILSAKNKNAYYNKIQNYSKEIFLQIFEKMKEQGEELLKEDEQIILSAVDQCVSSQIQSGSFSPSLIHSDLHPHNVLFQENNVAAILDFDSLRVSERIRDVGSALYRFGRQFFVNQALSEEEMKTRAKELSKKFLFTYDTLLPLAEKEKELLPVFLKDEFLKKLLFVLQGAYLEGNTTWKKDIFKFISALKEIDYFL